MDISVMLSNKKIFEYVLKAMIESNKIIGETFMELNKQKNFWIAKVITIASAIVGGVSLYKQPENAVVLIGLLLLLVVISVGLILVIISNNKLINKLGEAYGTSNDYSIRTLRLIELADKSELTQDEQVEKLSLEVDITSILKETGILKDDGTLGSIYDEVVKNTTIDWANYILIIGFFIAGVILLFGIYGGKHLIPQ